jgi:hypothetical protein
LMKEIKEDTNNVMTAPVHGWEESMFLKWPYTPNNV